MLHAEGTVPVNPFPLDKRRRRRHNVSTAVTSSSPALIKGEGIDWYSILSMEHTIVPGTGRWVKNNQNGLEVYRIIFWKQGMYQVRTLDDRSVQVEIREGDYLFGKPEMPVTAMSKRIQEADWLPGYKDLFRLVACFHGPFRIDIQIEDIAFYVTFTVS